MELVSSHVVVVAKKDLVCGRCGAHILRTQEYFLCGKKKLCSKFCEAQYHAGVHKITDPVIDFIGKIEHDAHVFFVFVCRVGDKICLTAVGSLCGDGSGGFFWLNGTSTCVSELTRGVPVRSGDNRISFGRSAWSFSI